MPTVHDTDVRHTTAVSVRSGPQWMAVHEIRHQFREQLRHLPDLTVKNHLAAALCNFTRAGKVRRREIDWTKTATQKRYKNLPASAVRLKYEYNVADLKKYLRERLSD